MRDLRLQDNRALSLASNIARRGSPAQNDDGKGAQDQSRLVLLHVLSPGDYVAHDRSPRRIDFVLRNLKHLQKKLHKDFDVPLCVIKVEPREEVPQRVLEFCADIGATHLFGNIEHEVDELRRDIKVLKLASSTPIEVDFIHDTCVVEPGQVLTKENKPYSIFSPWQRNWAQLVNQNIGNHIDASEDLKPNPKSIYDDKKFSKLFNCEIPKEIKGFELNEEDCRMMNLHWKEGEDFAHQLLEEFINLPIKASSTQAKLDFSKEEGKDGKENSKQSNQRKKAPIHTSSTRVEEYSNLRNRTDLNGTSQLSAYLASGVISIRACVRATLKKSSSKKLSVDRRDLGVGMWQSELAWRDFYQHVMAAWPRVSMGRCFNLKYEKVVWEKDEKILTAWKNGLTGFPFIDACMRQLNQIGYMHNRGRMCVAMFLTKDLMMDWKLGEKYFMQQLMDGDLGSNNGGWQWSSSTGTDAQPYFRIFSPLSQSEKCDPQGDFIKKFCPELKHLSGSAIHEPFKHLSKEKFEKLGYPKPIVDHSVARKRALARFKNPGSSANE